MELNLATTCTLSILRMSMIMQLPQVAYQIPKFVLGLGWKYDGYIMNKNETCVTTAEYVKKIKIRYIAFVLTYVNFINLQFILLDT